MILRRLRTLGQSVIWVTIMDKLLLTIEETRQAIGGQGRGKIYDLMKSGQLESVLDGTRRFVLAESVRQYVEKLRSGQNQIRPVNSG